MCPFRSVSFLHSSRSATPRFPAMEFYEAAVGDFTHESLDRIGPRKAVRSLPDAVFMVNGGSSTKRKQKNRKDAVQPNSSHGPLVLLLGKVHCVGQVPIFVLRVCVTLSIKGLAFELLSCNHVSLHSIGSAAPTQVYEWINTQFSNTPSDW